MVEVLKESGIQNPTNNIVAVRSWGTITFVMTKTSLRPNEVNSIRSFCEEMMFDPAILPHLSPEERTRYNQFQDDLFFDYVDKLTSSREKRFMKTMILIFDRPAIIERISLNTLNGVTLIDWHNFLVIAPLHFLK